MEGSGLDGVGGDTGEALEVGGGDRGALWQCEAYGVGGWGEVVVIVVAVGEVGVGGGQAVLEARGVEGVFVGTDEGAAEEDIAGEGVGDDLGAVGADDYGVEDA